ncbi:MAG: efflux RND transporter periplasmic adaptor subunit [Elusimicrobiaceae bacterium]|nr:efflux RND transporter periplasmic adaptor subunit [Elusimicrobiaceae bacterium]
MKKIQIVSAVCVCLAISMLCACHKKDASQQDAALPVTTIKVLKADLPWNMEYPAQVVGSLQVQVRAQVGGILKARLFDEGAYVQQGTQLFQIDPAEYEVALQRAEGALAQAQTDVSRTRRDYERMKKLRADNAVSQKDYDDSLSAYETAQASVKVAQAGVSDAKINLQYTKVLAPISGITGKEAQSVGSLVSPAGNGLLTTMVQIQPLWVNFSMPSSQFYKMAQGYTEGTIVLDTTGENPVYVEAITSDGRVYPEKGTIIFFDSTEDVKTSSLAIRAEFPNPTNQRMLMPGQFIRVRLIGTVYKEAVLVPSSAVLSTPAGDLVYIVQADNTVKSQPVKVQLQDNLYIVTEGLKGGETIISEGLIKIRPDMKVSPSAKDFSLPISATKQTVPSTTTAVNIDTLEEALEQDEKGDKQVLPNSLTNGQAPSDTATDKK